MRRSASQKEREIAREQRGTEIILKEPLSGFALTTSTVTTNRQRYQRIT